jgi:uncharacterized protein YkwD
MLAPRRPETPTRPAARIARSELNAAAITALLLLASFAFAQAPISDVPRETKLRLLELINEDRGRAGLAPVEFSEALSRLADEHCREMLREGYTSHWDRAGRKPYLRYAAAGLYAYTSENISAIWESSFGADKKNVWDNIRYAHRSFLAEVPPNDGHRRSILDPSNMLVGIGVSYNNRGMRLIEVFATKNAELEPLPLRASLGDQLRIRGRISNPEIALLSISVYYEPLPRTMSVDELRRTSSYGLPDEEYQERPKLTGSRIYADHLPGTIELDSHGGFHAPLTLWKGRPGVYTVAVWLQRGQDRPFIGAVAPIVVEAR